MQITREEAISKFRAMWNWMANESERTEIFKTKYDYLVNIGEDPFEIMNQCYACVYDNYINDLLSENGIEVECCYCCPIADIACNGGPGIPVKDTIWQKIVNFDECKDDLNEYISICREMANVPESPIKEEEEWVWKKMNSLND